LDPVEINDNIVPQSPTFSPFRMDDNLLFLKYFYFCCLSICSPWKTMAEGIFLRSPCGNAPPDHVLLFFSEDFYGFSEVSELL